MTGSIATSISSTNLGFAPSRINYNPCIVPSDAVELDRGNPLAVGLQGFWLLNTPNPIDYSGNEYHGVSTANPTLTNSQKGIVTSFDSPTNTPPYEAIVTSLLLNNQAHISVSAWVAPKSNNFAATGSPNPRFVANSHSDGDNLGFQIFFNAGAEQFTFDIGNGTTYGRAYAATASVNAGVWTHIVGTYDGSTVRVYTNGVIGSTTGSLTGSLGNSTHNVTIGYNPGTTTDFVSGSVSAVAIYNRALTQSEVTSLYIEPYGFLVPSRRLFFDVPPTASVQGVGAANTASTATASGSSSSSFVSQAITQSIASASGTSTTSATAQAIANSIASASGTSSVSGVTQVTSASIATSSGTSSVTGLASATAQTVAMTSGTSSVTGTAIALFRSVASTSGSSSVSGFGNALIPSVGTITTASTMIGISAQPVPTVGTIAGSSFVSGVGQAFVSSIGSISGSSTVIGIGGLPPPPVIIGSQSLYPQILFDAKQAMLAPNVIPSGTLALIALDMYYVDLMQVIVTQLSPWGEDFSLRAWVSQYPAGISVIIPMPSYDFPVARFAPRALLLYTPRQMQMPGTAILAPVINMRYFLNIQNLSNTAIAFNFVQTILA
jgi:hypothetical protein